MLQDVVKHDCHFSNVIAYCILLFIEEELYQEMSEKNKLKGERTEKKDEWLISELTSEEKTSKDVGIQFDLPVPTEGEHIILSSSFYSEGLTDNSQITMIFPHYQ